MKWYAAHIIVYLRFTDGVQDKYPIWENIVLIEAESTESAWDVAESLGRDNYDNTSSLVYWESRPGHHVFAGVRKIVECQDTPTKAVERGEEVFRLGSGTEITYSELELDSAEDLARLVEGEAVTIRYEE